MPITKREGFTLIELLIATIIFGLMIMSLAAIYSTANSHMLQNYRQNAIKSSALLAMKTISSRLSEATRIDSPAINGEGNELKFASNIDQLTGCYPINDKEPVTWHKFCYAPGITSKCRYGNCLYYHTGTVKTRGGVCPNGPAWAPPVDPFCGPSGLGTVIQLASFVQPPAGGFLFSRYRPADGALGNALVNIRLRVVWDPAAVAVARRGNFRSSRAIDTTLNTTVRVICAGR
jgi:prepilin-type N-terminal cleavage/methylation domain-containing protein